MSHKQEFELSINIQHVSTSTDKVISSPIVDRLLEVSDSTFRNEYVDYYALSDHICFAKTIKKDKINNSDMKSCCEN